MSNIKKFIGEVVDHIGEDRVFTSKLDRMIYSRDCWPLLIFKEYMGQHLTAPKAVIQPVNALEVSTIIRLANKYRVKLIVYGGGSGVLGGTLPTKDAVILDMSRMNKILRIDVDDMYVIVEPGVIMKDLEEELNRLGYTCRHIPQSLPEAQVGGLVATRSTGQYSTKYGGIENMILSLETVLPNGEIVETKLIPRRSVGPRLEELFIGSEGAFGVITKIAMKIYRIPKCRFMRCYVFDGFEEGLMAIREMIISGISPPIVRLYDREETEIRFHEFEGLSGKCLLLLLFEGHHEVVEAETKIADRFLSRYGSKFGEGPMERWFNTRFDVISEIYRIIPLNIVYDTIEVSGLWSQLPKIYENVKNRLMNTKNVTIVMAHASHFYHNGGCIYFTVGGVPENGLETYYINVWSNVMNSVLEVKGSISHHHGIGVMRLKWVKEELGSLHNILSILKGTLDPRGILNEGRLGL